MKKTKRGVRSWATKAAPAKPIPPTGFDAIEGKKVNSLTPVGERTDSERRFVDQYLLSRSGSLASSAPTFIAEMPKVGPPHIKPDPKVDKNLWRAQLAAATGSTVPHAQEQLMQQLLRISGNSSVAPAVELSNVLSAMLELAPKDPVEGRLAVQMICTHKAAMDLLRKGIRGEQSIELADFYLKHSERLMRLFNLQIDSLSRYRGKGPTEQKMTVEHVHVHEGGQAVLGNVVVPHRRANGEGSEQTKS